MANEHTNHSVLTGTGADQVLTLDVLQFFNTTLLGQLHLSTTAGSIARYIYASSGITNATLIKTGTDNNIAKNVKQALDQLFDLVADLNAGTVKRTYVSQSDKSTNTIAFYSQNAPATPLAKFSLATTDTNYVLSYENSTADPSVGTSKSDLLSIAGTYTPSTTVGVVNDVTVTGDTTATDPLTQKTYVDANISRLSDVLKQTYAGGKSTSTSAATVEFKTVDTTSNDYYFNATQGTTITNIYLNGDDFVKDKVLTSVKAQTYAQAVADTTTWTSDDITGFTTQNEKFTSSSNDVWFLFKFTIKHGQEASEYEYFALSLSCIVNNLLNGNGVTVTNGVIDLNIAQPDSYVKLGDIQYSAANVPSTDVDAVIAAIKTKDATATGFKTSGDTTKTISWISTTTYASDAMTVTAGTNTYTITKNGAQLDIASSEGLVTSSTTGYKYLVTFTSPTEYTAAALHTAFDNDTSDTATVSMSGTAAPYSYTIYTNKAVTSENVTTSFSDATNINISLNTSTAVDTQAATKTWSNDPSTTLATSDNLADVANELETQIDANVHSVVEAKNTTTGADAIFKVESATDETTGAITYNVAYKTITQAEITALFA